MSQLKSTLKSDLVAGFVVFLIAVPLCLGIALASGAPLFSGMIAGIIGGIVVGTISKSALSVSGPATGLTAIVLSGITTLGSFEIFLTAVIIAGIFQLILGLIKAGTIGYFVPSNVITGMLTAIGVLIILGQLPMVLGLDMAALKGTLFGGAEKSSAAQLFHPGIMTIGVLSMVSMVLWDQWKPAKLKLIPGAAIAVLIGILINQIFVAVGWSHLSISGAALVNLPTPKNFSEFIGNFTTPDFSKFFSKEVFIVAMTLGVVASLETLLTIEATDKIDPKKRFTDSNRELLAQGSGNILSGLIGGLPITSVIVRSSANLNAGSQSKNSAIFHGFMLLAGALIIPRVLNFIPIASLAGILVLTGYKLCQPKLFKSMFTKSKYQWVPFLVTVLAIVFTDLLVGVAIGMTVAVGSILVGNLKNTYYLHRADIPGHELFRIELAQEVSFLNKATLAITLDRIPENSTVIIDATKTFYIDHDVLELIKEFEHYKAPSKGITAILTGFKDVYNVANNDHIFFEEIPGLEKHSKQKNGKRSKDALKDLTAEFKTN